MHKPYLVYTSGKFLQTEFLQIWLIVIICRVVQTRFRSPPPNRW